MSIQIGAMGVDLASQELPQDGRGIRQVQIQLVERKFPGIKKEDPVISDKSLAIMQEAARDLEQISLAFHKKLKFMVNHKSHEVTIKVIDPQTDKVIKELPPEEIQRLRDRIRETIGILFDEQV
jgi:flagellar protein FlaG